VSNAISAKGTGDSTTPPPPSGAKTIIYIHGVGNKPPASVLKCQWDTALFGVAMGDRTRMAYWVNRERYPQPLPDTCGSKDVTAPLQEGLSALIPALGVKAIADPVLIEQEIKLLTADKRQQATLRSLADRMSASTAAGFTALSVEAKVLPLPEPLRRFFAQQITRVFLRDVNDFLFDAARREAMRKSLHERIDAGGGPFIVIAHSQGTMIAYDVLRELSRAQADVRLFVTMGSPLGMQEVQDAFRKFTGVKNGPLPFPPCVTKWLNVAERLDPVAIDQTISGDFAGPIDDEHGLLLNPDAPKNPHSATGYLSTKFVKTPVREAVGNGFGQEIKNFVIAGDLVDNLEDSYPAERRDVLIQLSDPASKLTMAETAAALKARLADIVPKSEDARIDVLKRFIAARLTRKEVETISAEFKNLNIETIWRDAAKRALIYQSTNTIQCRPANHSYGATGRRIAWAVLDTGIRATHPQFERYDNVVAQWNCADLGAPKPIGPDADDHGHGTHVAAIIAGSYEVKLKPGDDEPTQFAGMAPEVQLHGYKVLDSQGNGQDSYIIKALDHIASINEATGELVIHGVNLSLGGDFDPKVFGCGHTPLCQELRRLWRQGVVVVIAAGNEGYAVLQAASGMIQANIDLSIGDPANLDEAIAVGSVHKTNPHTYGISFFSSRGPTADGRLKPDVVAPGERILSACHQFPAGNPMDQLTAEELYVEMSGTSMAAPHVSGLIASFLSLRREFIGYPDRVKQMLLKSAVDLQRDRYVQGYGLPNLIMMLATN
jgi:subtilisin family serine protease